MRNNTPTPLTYYKAPASRRGFLLYMIEEVWEGAGDQEKCVGNNVVLIEFGKHYTEAKRYPLGEFISLVNEGRMVPCVPCIPQ